MSKKDLGIALQAVSGLSFVQSKGKGSTGFKSNMPSFFSEPHYSPDLFSYSNVLAKCLLNHTGIQFPKFHVRVY